MKKYILPVLTAAVLGFSSCNEEAATVQEAVETTATEVKNTAVEKVENVKNEAVQNTTAAVTETTTMSVDRMVHDFGTINDDQQVETKFTITNTGDKPLIITQAKGSCGCTVPGYPKAPIAPGGTGEIEVSYNPKGQNGAQNKTVTLIANTTPANTVMNIKSVVNKVTQ